MPIFKKLPLLKSCCYCVTDLKAAVAIIAVFGVVTCPAVSWAVIRHSYVIRVSCYITTVTTRPDIVDINVNNILSFGFGAHAGLRPSCLAAKKSTTTTTPPHPVNRATDNHSDPENSAFVRATQILGWVVFVVDVIFLYFSVNVLYRIFWVPNVRKSITSFLWSATVSVFFSFTYSITYIIACVSIGGAFPVFELLFCFVDVFVWIYFLAVVNSSRRMLPPNGPHSV